MGIRSSIWDSGATTFQPNRFHLYSFPLFSPENLFFTWSDTHNSGVTTCLPVSETHGPELLELTQSITATFPSLVDKNESPGTLSVATHCPGFSIAHGGQACCVCALSAEKSCHFCDENLCWRHIYQCTECHLSFCGECFDLHHAEGHWSDSDTAGILADSSCRRLESKCSTVIPSESTTKTTASVSRTLTAVTSISTACNSTLDKTYLLPFRGLFSIFAASQPEASR